MNSKRNRINKMIALTKNIPENDPSNALNKKTVANSSFTSVSKCKVTNWLDDEKNIHTFNHTKTRRKLFSAVTSVTDTHSTTKNNKLVRNIKCVDKSLNIVNQYKQSKDLIQNSHMQRSDDDDDDDAKLILNSQHFQPVADLHIKLKNSDLKEDILSISLLSDVIATPNHNWLDDKEQIIHRTHNNNTNTQRKHFSTATIDDTINIITECGMLNRNIEIDSKSVNIVNQCEQSKDVIQYGHMPLCDVVTIPDDYNNHTLYSQNVQSVTDSHIQYNSDLKEDILSISLLSDVIATLDEQNHIFNIENDLLDIKSIHHDNNSNLSTNMINTDQLTNIMIAIPDEQNYEYDNPSNEHSETIIHCQHSLVTYSSTEESESEKSPVKCTKTFKTRKRQKNPLTWKMNIKKQKVNNGEEHATKSGKTVPSKNVNFENLCKNTCVFKCRDNFSNDAVLEMNKNYYLLSRKDKFGYLLNFTERKDCVRSNNRSFSFAYYFKLGDANKIRVCKIFFLNTLSISQKPVYTVHGSKNSFSLTPPDENRGKNTLSKIPSARKDNVRRHIASYPTVKSHYCRSTTDKQYLDSTLNVTKMYDHYTTLCSAENEQSISMNLYREIFNNEFNLSFFCPKKDLCNLCAEYETMEKNNSTDDKKKEEYENHIMNKEMMRIERDDDKIIKTDTAVICFDLQNVITLPKTNVGIAFYKRKLCVYNMTAHCNLSKKVYCAIWSEATVGRSGNDLACAVLRCLVAILADNPNIKNIVTWSDSCVPQNRNSIISTAMIHFLIKNKQINSITMKYSVAGHSCIQEVDNAHSQIEKSLMHIEVWSPIGLIRALLNVNRKSPFQIIQMTINDLKNYHRMSKNYKFNVIPFGKIAQINFSLSNLPFVKYKTCHGIREFFDVNISNDNKPDFAFNLFNQLDKVLINNKITKEKAKDIRSLYNLMADTDKDYYESIFHNV